MSAAETATGTPPRAAVVHGPARAVRPYAV